MSDIRICVECGMENPEVARYCMRCGQALAAGRPPEQRVVVTGIGAVTSLGLAAEQYWKGLVEGRSGIKRITQFDPSDYPTQIAGLIDNFDAREFMDRKEARRMARFSQFAVAAARMALEDAELPTDGRRREDAGVLLGCAIGGLGDTQSAVRTMIERGGMRISPFMIVMIPPNMASFHVAKTFGFVGYNNTCTTACAAGTQAIGEAAEVIRRGDANVMITGGTEAAFSELGLAAFAVGRAYSTRNDEPEKASRPFDADRDGFVGGEGCGILVLESLSHALKRGARIYAEVLGYGASNDAYHLIAPDPQAEGAARAMRRALKNAGVDPTSVDYINAHGTGTPLGDVAETLAIKKALGDHAYEIVVNSSKSMIGHLWGAAGAVEAIATIKTLQTGIVHPTINLENPDPECDLDYTPLKPRRVRVNIAMSNSFGLGGQNASIVLSRYPDNGA
ncbi:MAG: beta-ketoacyl-[acyl-carrier-protein] synthase II [Chloroflexi bacterium]|nr:MAG: beta-ketoacyl-[acyl-carrier-protein] synthase II [Chloroflexota bacterium]